MRYNRSTLTYCCFLASCLLAWTIRATTASATAGPEVGQPAVWRHHDLIVPLDNLPTQYSCNDLWYKFRDVLLALGARADLKILTYRCADQTGIRGRSPRVHLQFSTPELVKGPQTRWAQISAASETVRLTPGQPALLRDSDCELVRQIKNSLLPELTQRIVSFDLACAAPRPSRRPFNVTVEALIPVTTRSRVAADVGEPVKPIR